MELFAAQAREFGAEIVKDEVVSVSFSPERKAVRTAQGGEYEARTVIICPGAEPRTLGLPGEGSFEARASPIARRAMATSSPILTL